jgi:1-acyl-sn-glycerol-3-phosphate acyltransferase
VSAARRRSGGIGALLRSLVFTTFFFVTVPVYSFPVLACAAFPYRVRYAIVQQWARMMLAALRVLCGLGFTVEGREHVPPGPCVVLLKHQSTWEGLAQVVIFPCQTWVLKRELMWVPFLGWALAVLRPIAIDRSAHRTALDQIVAVGGRRLRDGMWVMVFPEGTRVAPGAWRRYGLGGALLAKSAGVPVVPVAHNAGWYWRRRAWIKYPGTIRVRIGPPIGTTEPNVQEITDAARAWIDGQMSELDAAAAREAGQGSCAPQSLPSAGD